MEKLKDGKNRPSYPDLTEYQNTLKFKHEDFPVENYEFMHPAPITRCCDVVILPFNSDSENTKQAAIPVHKSLLQIIPYFRGQLNETFNWRETKNNNGIVTLEAPAHIGADSIFSYIESLYTSGELSITKKNCLEILRLAKFWCDDFVAEAAEIFIKNNINEEIFMTIVRDSELMGHLDDVIEQLAYNIFDDRQPMGCRDNFFVMDQIRKFSAIRSADLRFTNNFSDVEFVYEEEPHTPLATDICRWRTVFTKPISAYRTTMNFKINWGDKPMEWMNVRLL